MSQIPAYNPIGTTVQRETTSQFSDMTSEDFLKIMFTELTHQDPLAPSETGALLEQINSIRSIESDIAITEHLEALVFGSF